MHESGHTLSFPCTEPGCQYPPFGSHRALRRHISEAHKKDVGKRRAVRPISKSPKPASKQPRLRARPRPASMSELIAADMAPRESDDILQEFFGQQPSQMRTVKPSSNTPEPVSKRPNLTIDMAYQELDDTAWVARENFLQRLNTAAKRIRAGSDAAAAEVRTVKDESSRPQTTSATLVAPDDETQGSPSPLALQPTATSQPPRLPVEYIEGATLWEAPNGAEATPDRTLGADVDNSLTVSSAPTGLIGLSGLVYNDPFAGYGPWTPIQQKADDKPPPLFPTPWQTGLRGGVWSGLSFGGETVSASQLERSPPLTQTTRSSNSSYPYTSQSK
jgi:hypothetical protein